MKYIDQSQIKTINNIHNKLLECQKISIFVHESPDFDAICSSLALRDYLISKNIDARIIGLELADKNLLKKIYESFTVDKYDDNFIKSSVAIILDTANKERILTGKYVLANDILRIDHHPKIQTIGSIEWIDCNKSSTSEMIGWFILVNNKELNNRQANFLYTGILADTGKLMFSITSQSTLSLIMEFYNVNFNKQEVQDRMFVRSWKEIKIDSQIFELIKIENDIGVLLIDKEMSKKIVDNNISPSKVYLMNDIEGLKAWLCAYFDFELNVWKISLRSKWYNVREFAQQYNGGGHMLASGIKVKEIDEVNKIIDEFKKYNFNKI